MSSSALSIVENRTKSLFSWRLSSNEGGPNRNKWVRIRSVENQDQLVNRLLLYCGSHRRPLRRIKLEERSKFLEEISQPKSKGRSVSGRGARLYGQSLRPRVRGAIGDLFVKWQ